MMIRCLNEYIWFFWIFSSDSSSFFQIVGLIVLFPGVGTKKDGGGKDVQSQNCSDHSIHFLLMFFYV